MPFSITTGDILDVHADAVVVAANEQLDITGGVGMRVAMAAGRRKLQRACNELDGCQTGDAVVTPAFSLRAKHIVHVVGPVWQGGSHNEKSLLEQAYHAALVAVVQAGDASVAMPLISAGTYGYPAEQALSVAVHAIRAFLDVYDLQVTLVLYDRRVVRAGLKHLDDLSSYLDEARFDLGQSSGRIASSSQQGFASPAQGRLQDNGIESIFCPRCGRPLRESNVFCPFCGTSLKTEDDSFLRDEGPYVWEKLSCLPDGGEPIDYAGSHELEEDFAFTGSFESVAIPDSAPDSAPAPMSAPSYAPEPTHASMPAPMAAPKSKKLGRDSRARRRQRLDAWLQQVDEPLSDTLLALIDERGLTDAQVYKRANISRQVFNKIKNDVNYHPKKTTVLALCVALELGVPQTKDVLSRAGYSLNHSSTFDLIVEYYITRGIFDSFEINEALFAYDQPLLGAS